MITIQLPSQHGMVGLMVHPILSHSTLHVQMEVVLAILDTLALLSKTKLILLYYRKVPMAYME